MQQTLFDLPVKEKKPETRQLKPPEIRKIEEEKESLEQLYKELSTDRYKYDLRFWPDNKISLEAIKAIAEGRLEAFFHRIDYVIREAIKAGATPEQIHSLMMQNLKQKTGELARGWWDELNTSYKKTVTEKINSGDVEGILQWGKHSVQSYKDYLMFSKAAGQVPQPEPGFIQEARQAYLRLKQERGQEKHKNGKWRSHEKDNRNQQQPCNTKNKNHKTT